MPLTEQDRAWHETYEQLTPEAKEAVDLALRKAGFALRMNGYQTAYDDRAEALVAAITRFLMLSNPGAPVLRVRTFSDDRPGPFRPAHAPETEWDRHLRHLLKETAVRHKDILGAAETKQVIFRYGGGARKLPDVPIEKVPPLHRVLQGQIDRATPRHTDSSSGRRVTTMHPDLAAPYGVSREKAEKMRDDFRSTYPDVYATMAAYGNVGSAESMAKAYWDERGGVPPISEKPTGGGSFDGGGASGNWDASPSSSDPSNNN